MAERTTNLTKFGFEATNMGPIVGCNGDPHPTMGYHGLNRRCRQNTYCSGLGISCSIMFHAGVMEKPSTLPLVVEAAWPASGWVNPMNRTRGSCSKHRYWCIQCSLMFLDVPWHLEPGSWKLKRGNFDLGFKADSVPALVSNPSKGKCEASIGRSHVLHGQLKLSENVWIYTLW